MAKQAKKHKYPNNVLACLGNHKKATIARDIGIPERTFWRILDEGAPIPPDKLLPLAERLGVQPDDLLRKREIWNIPYQRNPFFTGRDEELERLHHALHKSEIGAGTRAYALCGLGGIGKTQIVLEYAYRYRDEYHAIMWVKADNRESLLSDMLSLASLLNLPERDAQDQAMIRAAVARWLREQRSWLLIFDNADDLALVQEFLPTGYRGHILLTTRAQALGRLACRLEVEEMRPEVGALFLLRRAGRIASDAPLDAVPAAECGQALELALELGGLPLALDQAGAYMEETPCSLVDYQRSYQEQRLALLARRGGIVNDHPESVAATWSISFAEVECLPSAGADLLRACAFLDPDTIPEELIVDGAAELGPQLSSVASDILALNQAMSALWKYSLVRRNLPSKILSLHRLVQVVLKDTMDKDTQHVWAERVVRAVHRVFPASIEVGTWECCRRFLSQAQNCAALIDQFGFAFLEAAQLLNQVAYYLRERARYPEAEVLYQRALALRRQQLGEIHLDTAQSCYNLARLYFDTTRYEEAEALYRQALSIRRELLGNEHVMVAQTLNSIALTFWCWGVRYEQAEQLYEEALTIFDRTVGREHQLTAHCMNNLALLHVTLTRYAEAECLNLQVLAIRERLLPAIHLDTAQSLQNLASVYVEQGNRDRYPQAERLLRHSLEIREHLLGPDHPQTARSLHNLAVLYQAQGQYMEAERLCQRALVIREKTLGTENRKTLTTRKTYSALLRQLGREAQAVALERNGKSMSQAAPGTPV